MQQSCFPCIPLLLETIFQNKSNSSRLDLIILGKTPKIPFVLCLSRDLDQTSRAELAEQNRECWEDFPADKPQTCGPSCQVLQTLLTARREYISQALPSSTHTEIRGFPCLNRDFLKESISARFSAEEACVESRAVLGWILCFAEASEHWASAQKHQSLSYGSSDLGRKKFFCNISGKEQCSRARYIDGPLLWHFDLV